MTDQQPLRRTPAKYSIIRYVPDTMRNEGANIGVLIWCEGNLRGRVGTDNPLLPLLTGLHHQHRDYDYLNDYVPALIASRLGETCTVDELAHFIATRANHVRFTPLRPCSLVASLSEEVNRMYKEYVQ